MYILDKLRLFEDFGYLFLRLRIVDQRVIEKGLVKVLKDSQIVVVVLYILSDFEDSESDLFMLVEDIFLNIIDLFVKFG